MTSSLFNDSSVESQRIFYTPSNFAKISLLHLQEIGDLQAQKIHINKRHGLTSYLFFIVLSGSGILEYNGSTYMLQPNDCVFIDCQKTYSHQTSENLWRLQWLHFYGINMSTIYEKYLERGGQPSFHPQKITDFKKIWSQLFESASSSNYILDMHINEILNKLLTLLMYESWNPNTYLSTSKKQNLIDIKVYLDTHFSEKIYLDYLANMFYINKFYLTRIFKKQFGVSINDYLSQVRISHAKQLLRFTNKTVENIGIECGIDDVHYFSRTFKKIEGISPSEYRQIW
ncbi:MAG: AraC family transcriptional regulator [Anaeroplasmataceae bacterium]|nr:AraC family transcriptional regulator [Anaeroplasmataceae bacterium]